MIDHDYVIANSSIYVLHLKLKRNLRDTSHDSASFLVYSVQSR